MRPRPAGTDADPDVLLGWRELEEHFERSERQLRRWQRDWCLPVRRIGRHVILRRSEIDRWIWWGSEVERRYRLPGPDGRRMAKRLTQEALRRELGRRD